MIKDLEEFPEELSELKRTIQYYHLEHCISISGKQASLEKALSNTHVGIIPSLSSEVICRVAVEFFSLGIPSLHLKQVLFPKSYNLEKTDSYVLKTRQAV